MAEQKLNAWKFALALGIVSGICAALTTVAAMYDVFVDYVNLAVPWLEAMYGFIPVVGYSVSWIGVALGAVYCFITAFIFTLIVVLIYNKLVE